MKLCALRRTPAAFAGDDLILALTQWPYNNRLDHAPLGNRGGKFFQRCIVEMTPGLVGMRRDRRNRQHCEARRRRVSSISLSGVGHQRLFTPGFAEQCPQPAAERRGLSFAAALRLGEEDLALLTPAGADVLPGKAFGAVTRFGLRRAADAGGRP